MCPSYIQSCFVAVQKVPDGYERKTSVDNGSSYFVNVFTGVRWYSAETEAGKVYYYEENGNESCWVLPNVSQTIQVILLQNVCQ